LAIHGFLVLIGHQPIALRAQPQIRKPSTSAEIEHCASPNFHQVIY
jgi:hypothetical protein